MKGYIKTIDDLPRALKVIFAIIPILNVVWLIYVIFNAINKQSWLGLIIDILLYFTFIWWLFNLVWIIVYDKPFTVTDYIA